MMFYSFLNHVAVQKFVAIDEATVMQEIIDERDVEIKKVRLLIFIYNAPTWLDCLSGLMFPYSS